MDSLGGNAGVSILVHNKLRDLAAKGAKLTVTDETVDMKWVETYGADKMAVG